MGWARLHLPITDCGIVIVFEYGSSSTGITVTSSLSDNNDFSILIQDDLKSKYKSLNKEEAEEIFNELLDECVNSKSINGLSARARSLINFLVEIRDRDS